MHRVLKPLFFAAAGEQLEIWLRTEHTVLGFKKNQDTEGGKKPTKQLAKPSRDFSQVE